MTKTVLVEKYKHRIEIIQFNTNLIEAIDFCSRQIMKSNLTCKKLYLSQKIL